MIGFSIVIATLNGAGTLRKTLGSVFAQSCPDWEVIVQDGGSTDGTLAILKEAEKHIAWRSEPDRGIYDAWNKALRRTSGDWVLFLGADDCLLHRHVLTQCLGHLARLPEHVLFAYGACIFSAGMTAEQNTGMYRSLRDTYHFFLLDMPLPFPATFIRAALLGADPFDASYAIAGDYDLAARLATRANIARLPVWVGLMRKGGVSSAPESSALLDRERDRVLRTRIVPRAAEFAQAVADLYCDCDTSLEPVPQLPWGGPARGK